MGVVGSLTHFLLATVIKATILWVVLMFFLGLGPEKAGTVMLLAFVATLAGNIVASLLLRSYRGY